MREKPSRPAARTRVLAVVVAVIAGVAVAAPAQAQAPKDFWGVTIQGTTGEYDAFLMQQAGVDTVRVHLNMGLVQSTPGRCQARVQVGPCDWRTFDAFVGEMARFGLTGFPYLLNVPGFIDQDPNVPPVRSGEDRRAWSDFVEAAVKRYGRGGEFWRTVFAAEHPGVAPRPIEHWEIWNEPSDGSYWHPRPNAREYAELLELSGRAIHRVDQRADVVFAGLFGTPQEANGGIKAFKYYRQAFARPGIKRHFDSVAVHPYGPTMTRVKTQMDWLLEEMAAAGLRGREIWVTELAWSSSDPPTILGVGPEGQAAMLKQSFSFFERQRRRWNIAGLHWYAWQDLGGAGLCEFCEEAGLVTFDRQPKPSYHAFAEIAR